MKNAKLSDLFSYDGLKETRDHYLECQIHGQDSHKMTPYNIDEVIFSVEPPKQLQEKLRKNNIPWRIL